MDLRGEISEFLRSRRSRITPESAGLSAGGNRRVPGLRREEVAVLAAISVDWYVRIERGNLSGVSDEVLHALADALQLDDAERQHLFDLARASAGPGRRGAAGSRFATTTTVSAGLIAMLESMTGMPAWVRNHRFEVLAANPLARALYSPLFGSEIAQGNNALFTFLDPLAREFFVDWERNADDIVAVLRGYAGAHPDDRELSTLIGQLATQSPEFSHRWAAHDVKHHRTGRKLLHHPIVGDLELGFEALTVPADASLHVFVYHPLDASSREALQLLASWDATERAEGDERAEDSERAGDADGAEVSPPAR
ncbi:helix-turn-helix transcriptional regulator [Schumannella luteola]|uniref:Transcriptional regulator with XRE-family HTH domain n=1 Tax=Schumannella luteola TaxID=472059 RepID=A0A852Y980_9MICO|nr:helix-turn-helix transcriptional regulator [Schumannella luteola]NYG98973.1 transcriptional regulator with XRE-family HTH domain [Schumannella luteola]TPX06340.1 helix-turn-helix domain-containing protein [Schumannella luteola]